MRIRVRLNTTDVPLGLRAHVTLRLDEGLLDGYEIAGFKVWQASRNGSYTVTSPKAIADFFRLSVDAPDGVRQRLDDAILAEYQRAISAHVNQPKAVGA